MTGPVTAEIMKIKGLRRGALDDPGVGGSNTPPPFRGGPQTTVAR
jgi:hypothetical protein